MSNPLLDMNGLPPFSRIEPKHIEAAIDHLLHHNREAIARLLEGNSDTRWDGIITPIEDLEDRLSRVWVPVSHMNSVADNEALRDAYNACLPKLSNYATEMGQNPALMDAYKRVRRQDKSLDTAQKKALDDALRDFRLSGIDLPAEQRERFRQISEALSGLANRYSQNVLDATHGWSKLISDESRLSGLPESARGLARQTAEQQGLDGWLLTLEQPSFLPLMAYADDEALRCEVYEAFSTRASDQGPKAGEWDNSEAMEEILANRHELARLLGFANYAERSLATKMADSPDEVLGFLRDLAAKAKPQAERELAELRAFAEEQHGNSDLRAWDIAYYAEKLRQHRYNISQEELKPWFPETRVIPGLFAVVERLYGLRIDEKTGIDTWRPDVRFFEIHDTEGRLRGQFYLDLYARPHKRGGAWMDDCVARRKTASGIQTPVAFLTCNFSPPVGEQPALLTHDDVITLFHEFGHGLHHMLTLVDYPEVSGINGVPWDAVELPSQFMENWCWEKEALDLISGHVDSGEPIPDELYQRMLAAKNFQSAMAMVRQLEFSIFDFRIHLEYDPARGGRIYEILDEVRQQVAVIQPPAFNRFAHAFSHIFAGGYAAGYYSYKWAEVLSADAYSLFEEKGIFSQEAGGAFLHNILEKGGSADPMSLYTAFRGRKPSVDALLRHNGIDGKAA